MADASWTRQVLLSLLLLLLVYQIQQSANDPRIVPSPANPHESSPVLSGERLAAGADGQLRLSDRQLRQFIARGYILLSPPEFDAEFHAVVAATAEAQQDPVSSSNNLAPLLPNATRVVHGPTVRGARCVIRFCICSR